VSAARAKYKLLSCNVFQRELSAAIAASPSVIDPEFLELGLHETPEALRSRLQERIDAAELASALAAASPAGGAYDAILLGYGLCGNGLVGVAARRLPIVLPRAHDCCTVLLGSRSAFLERFSESLSASWSSAGYIERGSTYFRASELGRSVGYGLEMEELAAQYGEENAAYIWETMHPQAKETKLRFIEMPETSGLGYAEAMRAKAAEEGKEFLLIPGDSRLLRALLAGGWDEGEFLVVPPGKSVVGVYDHELVISAE
jgi:hypothetical protein